jgi:hypothetical protein
VKPKTIRIGDELGNGYMEEEMMETFRRYMPKAELEAFLAEQKQRSEEAGAMVAKAQRSRSLTTAQGANRRECVRYP